MMRDYRERTTEKGGEGENEFNEITTVGTLFLVIMRIYAHIMLIMITCMTPTKCGSSRITEHNYSSNLQPYSIIMYISLHLSFLPA